MESRLADNSKNSGVPEPGGYPAAPGESEIPGPSLLEVLWPRRWIVVGATILSLAAGIYYLSEATPIFESTSRLYVEKEGPVIISERDGMIMTQSSNYLYTQVELLRSVPILSAAVDALDIQGMRTFAGITDDPVVFLREACLDVRVGHKDELLSVSARSPYPRDVARIVNAVVDSYVSYHAQTKQTTAGQILKILKTEKKEREEELREKLEAIVDFKKNAGVLIVESDQQNLLVKRLAQLWDALAAAELEAIDAKVARDAIQKAREDPALRRDLVGRELQSRFEFEERESLRLRRQLRQDLHLAQETLRGLREEYTEECPLVRAAQGRIRSLELEIQAVDEEIRQLETRRAREEEELLRASVAAAEQGYQMAKEKEEHLKEVVERYEDAAADSIVKQAEYAVLESDRKRAEDLSNILDSRIKEINVTENTGALNISILEVAKPGDDPVEPQKPRTMALALALGLMLGVALAFLRDWMDKRLRSTDEMAAVLGAPVLGVVPHMKGPKGVSRIGRRVHLDPQSLAAEAYRTIRTAVYFNATKGGAKTLVVTSPGPADGKTTMASNLAICMAQAGQRILILDADFRRPSQHKVLRLKRRHSESGSLFPEVLSGDGAGDGRWKECIRPTGIDGLDILPCESLPSNPVEILNSQTFARVLEELAGLYDRVIIDSPPLLPVADARILGALSDVTVVVLRAEKSTRKIAEMAREGLQSVGAHILGVVVNDVPRRKGGYGYYGYYGGYKYSRYGSSSDGRSRRRRGSEKKERSSRQAASESERGEGEAPR